MFNVGLFDKFDVSLLIPTIFILALSILLGTSLSLFMGFRILKPISDFCDASKQVANGDFSIRLKENSPIHDMKMMSKNFNSMVKELSGIETLRSDFVNNVSHEFKTPLSAIAGYATLLQNSDLTKAEQNHYTNYIISSSMQLSKLTNNILSLAKLENQEIITDKKMYRLDEEIRKSILLLEPEWILKDILFNIDLPKQSYYGNSVIMRQVWANLIGNAIKYSDKYGEISITLKKDIETISIIISDKGIGMTSETQKHLFEKFYQGDSVRKNEGNGLGLSLVDRILNLCECKLLVESQIGVGTKMTVILPYE